MFVEFESASRVGQPVSFSLLNISNVTTDTSNKEHTAILMTNGVMYSVNAPYIEVMNKIRSQCK